jgi:hypothetical protein
VPLRVTIQWDFEAPDGADPEDFRRWVDNAWREHSRQDDPLYDINRMVLGNGQVIRSSIVRNDVMKSNS